VGTTIITVTRTAIADKSALLDAIARWTENLIDLDVCVDDARRDGDLDAIIAAVADRDQAVAHLTHLMAVASEARFLC
jgi:hypothetical protein